MASIRDFFKMQMDSAPESDEKALRRATAALLIEVSRADSEIDDEEETAIYDALRESFDLDGAEIDALVLEAQDAADVATCLREFTTRLNEQLEPERKVQILEWLWRVAWADRRIEAHEQHLMRKLAGLLYVGQKDYVAAKLRARRAVLASDHR
ncbi:MAG: TerB family tellurite resistance protein [Gammaproteobacteria bacterium]|nr:TerB family tellurite resistance protein [Gammaproteobacteria bacterium]